MPLRLAVLLVPTAFAQPAADPSALAPGRVQILHNAPDPALAALDVYINGVRLPGLDDLAFRTASPFIDVSPGTAITVAVARDTSEGIAEALVLGSFVAQADTEHRVYIEGLDRYWQFADNPDGLSTRLSARVVRARASIVLGAQEPKVTLGFLQGAPDLGTVGYDVFAPDGSGFIGFGAAYGGGISAVRVPRDGFTLRLRIPGIPEFDLGPQELQIPENDFGLLFLSGFVDPAQNQDGPSLGLYVLTGDGAVRPVASLVADQAPPEVGRAGLVAYPNPASQATTLRMPAAPSGTVIEVFDVQGRRVATQTAAPRAAEHRLDVSNWTPGVYLVHARSGDGDAARTVFSVVR